MRVAVIGGGIAGLAAAWSLRERADVTVFESAAQVGGKLALGTIAGVSVDVGAEALLTVRPEAVGLVEQAGLTDDRISPMTLSAWLRAGGRLHRLPTRTMMGIPADPATLSGGVLSDAAIARVAAEPQLAPLPELAADVSVGSLVRQRYGAEVVERLVDPLLGGVYAGRADGLSLRATVPALAAALAGGGSLLQAVASVTDAGTRSPSAGPIFTALRGGVGRLPHALAAQLAVRTASTVRSIRRTTDGFALIFGAVPVAAEENFDAVILAVPAAKAARLLEPVAAAAASELASIEAASMAIVTLAFDGVSLPDGSGVLVGSREGLSVKAATISSQKWPLEAGGLSLLRASVGRAGESEDLQRSDEELLATVRRDLRDLFAITEPPVDYLVTRWGAGLPQYAPGHVEKVARIKASVATVPGLAVCGATYDGVGIPACIASAQRAADQVLATASTGAQ